MDAPEGFPATGQGLDQTTFPLCFYKWQPVCLWPSQLFKVVLPRSAPFYRQECPEHKRTRLGCCSERTARCLGPNRDVSSPSCQLMTRRQPVGRREQVRCSFGVANHRSGYALSVHFVNIMQKNLQADLWKEWNKTWKPQRLREQLPCFFSPHKHKARDKFKSLRFDFHLHNYQHILLNIYFKTILSFNSLSSFSHLLNFISNQNPIWINKNYEQKQFGNKWSEVQTTEAFDYVMLRD